MGMDGDGMIEVLGPKLKDSIWHNARIRVAASDALCIIICELVLLQNNTVTAAESNKNGMLNSKLNVIFDRFGVNMKFSKNQ